MSLIRYLIILLLGLLEADTISAQQRQALTVEECIKIGLENSKTLHLSQMKVQYADAKTSEVKTSRLPSLKFGGTYSRLSKVPPFEVSLPLPSPAPAKFIISPSILDNYGMRLTLLQPLFTGFRLQSSIYIAEYNAQSTEQDYSKDKVELIYNIKNAYWSLFKAIEFKGVVDENVEQVKAHLKDIQNLFAQGMVTNNEVLKVQVQLSNVQLLQIDSENAVRLAMMGLNNLIGISLDTEIHLESNIRHQPKEYPGLHVLLQKALWKRPEVKAMEYRVKAIEAGVILARSGWFPQIFLTGNYYYSRPNQRILPTQDKFKDTWDVGIAISLDIWNWGTTIHQTNQAQAQLSQAQDALGQLKDAITLEVTQNYLSLLQAKEKIAVAEEGVKQAEENYRITSERFKKGLELNSDLLDAEFALLQAKTNNTQVLVDYELAQARIQKAIGE